MFEWWLVRAVEQVGMLTTQEWRQLASAGRRWEIAPYQRVVWGPAAGVILVSRGAVRLLAQDLRCRRSIALRHGDMVGTVQRVSCLLQVEEPTALHVFSHGEWLAALHDAPQITQKLLQGMALSALQEELQLHPSSSNPTPLA